MIDVISFRDVCPDMFKDSAPKGAESEIWSRNFDLKKGERILVKAESGRGKTSFCNFISLSREDYSGEIFLGGILAKSMKKKEKLGILRNGISVMYQELKLFAELNAVENVMLRASLCGGLSSDRVTECLERLGIDGSMRSRAVRTLSLGQQQRVAFVRMLCTKADFRILDEPVSHLDPATASIMAEMLRESRNEDGAGIIVTSVGYDFPFDYDRQYSL